MHVGMIGLGRMGKHIALHLLEQGVQVVGFNRTAEVTKTLVPDGLIPAYTLAELCQKLPTPRIILMMVPAGAPVDEVIEGMLPHLSKKDIVVDAGNSHYADSKRRYVALKKKGIHFLDCGTSGGLEGARHGACLTIGGDEEAFTQAEPVFSRIAMPQGCLYCGESGAGHYVKMVHNGIEYALLQSYAEGFALLEKAPYPFDLEKIAGTWSKGSVIRSWITELAQRAFSKDARLSGIRGIVGGGETGRWTVEEAHERNVEVPTIELALKKREASQKKETFAGKVVAALRNEFGGHEVVKK